MPTSSSSPQPIGKRRGRPKGCNPEARKKSEGKMDSEGNLIPLRHKRKVQYICRLPLRHPTRHRRKRCEYCVKVTESAFFLHCCIDAVGRGGVVKPSQVEQVITMVRERLNIGICQVRNVFKELSDKDLIFHTNKLRGYISTKFTTLYRYFIPYEWETKRKLPPHLSWIKWEHSIQAALLIMLVKYSDRKEMQCEKYYALVDLLRPQYEEISEKIRDIPTKKGRISETLKMLWTLKHRKIKN